LRLLNPHDAYWLSAKPVEIEAWFRRLKDQGEPVVSFGDLEDARQYLVGLIKPGLDNRFITEIVKRTSKMPVRLFVVGGKVIDFVVEEAVSSEFEKWGRIEEPSEGGARTGSSDRG